MATQLEKFDSSGGFSVEKIIHIDELHNAKELNSLEIKNSQFTDSSTTNYILRGLNTAVLQLDNVGTQIPIASNTLNFITGNIIAVNPTGVVYGAKIESVASFPHEFVFEDIPGGTYFLFGFLDLPPENTFQPDPTDPFGESMEFTVDGGEVQVDLTFNQQ